jgi:hypothetical protein
MTTENITPIQPDSMGGGAPVSAPSEAQLEELSEATALHSVAVAYHHQADRLLGVVQEELKSRAAEFSLPVRFLHSHAIELYLKSFLRLRSTPMDELKYDFRHKLGELYAACGDLGFAVEEKDRTHVDTTIERLKSGHEDHEFRYFKGSISTVDPDWIQAAAVAISAPVRAELDSRSLEMI